MTSTRMNEDITAELGVRRTVERVCPCGEPVRLWFNGGKLDSWECSCRRIHALEYRRVDYVIEPFEAICGFGPMWERRYALTAQTRKPHILTCNGQRWLLRPGEIAASLGIASRRDPCYARD